MNDTLKESEKRSRLRAVKTHVGLNPSEPVHEQNIEEQEDHKPAKTRCKECDCSIRGQLEQDGMSKYQSTLTSHLGWCWV